MALKDEEKQFDKDGSGKLENFEEQAYRNWVSAGRPQRQTMTNDGTWAQAASDPNYVGTVPKAGGATQATGTGSASTNQITIDGQVITIPDPVSNTDRGVSINLGTRPTYSGGALAGGGSAMSKDIISNGYARLNNPELERLVVDAGKAAFKDKFDWATSPDYVLEYAVKVAANKGINLADALKDIADNGVGGSSGSGGGSGGPFHTVNRSVQLTNEGTARRLLNTTLANYLGREASQDEIGKFLKALNVQEKANPTTTITSGYSNGKGSTTSNSTSTGGFDSADYATRFAQAQKGAGEYKAATTYMDAFMSAIRDPNRMI